MAARCNGLPPAGVPASRSVPASAIACMFSWHPFMAAMCRGCPLCAAEGVKRSRRGKKTGDVLRARAFPEGRPLTVAAVRLGLRATVWLNLAHGQGCVRARCRRFAARVSGWLRIGEDCFGHRLCSMFVPFRVSLSVGQGARQVASDCRNSRLNGATVECMANCKIRRRKTSALLPDMPTRTKDFRN